MPEGEVELALDPARSYTLGLYGRPLSSVSLLLALEQMHDAAWLICAVEPPNHQRRTLALSVSCLPSRRETLQRCERRQNLETGLLVGEVVGRRLPLCHCFFCLTCQPRCSFPLVAASPSLLALTSEMLPLNHRFSFMSDCCGMVGVKSGVLKASRCMFDPRVYVKLCCRRRQQRRQRSRASRRVTKRCGSERAAHKHCPVRHKQLARTPPIIPKQAGAESPHWRWQATPFQTPPPPPPLPRQENQHRKA